MDRAVPRSEPSPSAAELREMAAGRPLIESCAVKRNVERASGMLAVSAVWPTSAMR